MLQPSIDCKKLLMRANPRQLFQCDTISSFDCAICLRHSLAAARSFIGAINASGNVMEPMHALRPGAAACPAVEIKGVAGNAAHGKAF